MKTTIVLLLVATLASAKPQIDFANIGGTIAKAAQGLAPAVTDVVDQVSDELSTAGGDIGETLGNVAQAVSENLPEIPESIQNIAASLGGQLIAEAQFVMCGERKDKIPVECKCEDKSMISQPFTPASVLACHPTACKCMTVGEDESETVTVDLEEATQSRANPVGRLNRLCDGEAPTKCTCIRKDEDIEAPFTVGSLFSIMMECGPNKCTCEDGTIRKTPNPIRPLLDLQEMCDGDLPESCSCDDDSTMTDLDPTKIPELMSKCKPITCKCSADEEEQPFQSFGCVTGGAPNCIGESGDKGKLLCDGKVLTVSKLVVAKRRGKCVCENLIKPVCSNTNKTPRCPDGSEPDDGITGVPQDHIKACNDPEEE